MILHSTNQRNVNVEEILSLVYAIQINMKISCFAINVARILRRNASYIVLKKIQNR